MRSELSNRVTIPLLLTALGAGAAQPAAAAQTAAQRAAAARRAAVKRTSVQRYSAPRPAAYQAAVGSRVVVPQDTVVRARLNDRLSSRTASEGDRFTATLTDTDRSGFPEGTRFEGQVTEVQRASKEQPGVVDVDFRRAILPDSSTVTIRGSLSSLDEDNVRRGSSGRLEARRRSSGKLDAKWIGYGAGAGAVLATVLGGKFLKGALLGSLGGAAYAYLNRDKAKGSYSEVELAEGAEFGIRLHNQVAFNDASGGRRSSDDGYYRTTSRRTVERYTRREDADTTRDDRYTTRDDVDTTRSDRYTTRGDVDTTRSDRYATRTDRSDRYDTRDDRYTTRDDRYDSRDDRVYDRDTDQVRGRREELRFSTTLVRVNGRTVEARPINLGGTMYLPLRPIARASEMRLEHFGGEDRFTLHTRSGVVRGSTLTRTQVTDAADDRVRDTAPVLIDGEVYVTTDFLSRSADMRVNWNERTKELDLSTYSTALR